VSSNLRTPVFFFIFSLWYVIISILQRNSANKVCMHTEREICCEELTNPKICSWQAGELDAARESERLKPKKSQCSHFNLKAGKG
jgi:hypothetical protein